MDKLSIIEHKNQKVLTTAQLAEFYETETRRISENYKSNWDRYLIGIHYYCLEESELSGFKNEYGNSVVDEKASRLYIWTEKGALLHAKSLNTDKAWDVYGMLVDTYFHKQQFMTPQFLIASALIEAQKMLDQKDEQIQKQHKEIQYKEDVIIGLVDEVSLAGKREILNRVVRHNGANFQERWKELYWQFEMKYHINVKQRMEGYNKDHKPKMKSYLDYVDAVMGKVPELYEIAAKLYENDIKELTEELYALV